MSDSKQKLNTNSLKYIFTEDIYSIGNNISTDNENLIIENNPVDSTQEKPMFESKTDILILNHGTIDHQSENGVLLSKILQSINRSIDSVDIIDPVEKGLKSENIQSTNISLLLILGINPFELGFQNIQINKYSLTEGNGMNILYCDDLKSISTSVDSKKALWLNLKKAFNI